MSLDVGHLDKSKSPCDSFYVYVCADWNDADDNGCEYSDISAKIT